MPWLKREVVYFQMGLTENSLILTGFLIIPVNISRRMGCDSLMNHPKLAPNSSVGIVGRVGPQK